MKLSLFLVCLIFLSLAWSNEVNVRSHNTLSKNSRFIYLRDIAHFKGFSSTDTKILNGIRLGNAPEPGEKRNFTNLGLSEIFRRHLPELSEEARKTIRIKLPKSVRVEMPSTNISRIEVEQRLLYGVLKLCKGCYISVERLTLPVLPSGLKIVDWSISFDGRMPRGPFTLPLVVRSQAQGHKKYWLRGEIKVFRDVYVAGRALASGIPLNNDDIEQQRRDVTYARDEIPSREQILRLGLKRSFIKSQIIWRRDLRRIRAVRSGQRVKVLAGGRNLEVSLSGIARQSGFLGETIKVLNPQSKKMIFGQIVDQGVVRVGRL